MLATLVKGHRYRNIGNIDIFPTIYRYVISISYTRYIDVVYRYFPLDIDINFFFFVQCSLLHCVIVSCV